MKYAYRYKIDTCLPVSSCRLDGNYEFCMWNLVGYRQPLIFQYIYHIKLATLGAYIKFHNLLSVKSIILFG